MSNYRDSANLRALHDRMECPPECPICARIELCDQEERGAKDYMTVFDYPEEY
jgi:hypothetical protein